ncbi:MAG TPA: dipeptide ABC transporter ATP-binding protein [Syntrophorhabdaceae bacterium]|nr:dipeptide ABC transporter ATP-binding protein [Syntrophorhabdaceae bacterium]
MTEHLLDVIGLKKHFAIDRGWGAQNKAFVRAVDGVDFSIDQGRTLGLVGESGCGKTTVGRLILKLIEPTEGKIVFDNRDLTGVDAKNMRPLRRSMQFIFQDPFASLNPRMTIGEIVGRPMEIHHLVQRSERDEQVCSLLEAVGLRRDQFSRYPHEFSGGQRQRIGIARALATKPKLVVADEPTSALDVSVQAQILNLMKDLQEKLGLAYLFISHNIGVIRHISDRVGVMYLGRIVEMADKASFFKAPAHPYSRALLNAVPSLHVGTPKKRVLLQGDVPSPINPPPGCPFHNRCPNVLSVCRDEETIFKQIEEGHWVACHLYQ